MTRKLNCLQIVALYTAWPHLILWLSSQDFKGVDIALWITSILYLIGFYYIYIAVLNFLGYE